MKTAQIKSLLIHGKEWFDRANGNSYHSARYTVNFGMKSERSFSVPYQYGYGSCYLQSVAQDIAKRCGVEWREVYPLHCQAWKTSAHIETGCRKRDVIEWGAVK